MPTRIVIPIAPPDGESGGGLSWGIEVEESFSDTVEKLFPVSPATSSLQHRVNITFTRIDGRKVLILPQLVHCIEELEDE